MFRANMVMTILLDVGDSQYLPGDTDVQLAKRFRGEATQQEGSCFKCGEEGTLELCLPFFGWR